MFFDTLFQDDSNLIASFIDTNESIHVINLQKYIDMYEKKVED